MTRFDAAIRSDSAISLKNVGKVFDGSVEAVSDVSVNIESGEFVALLGPSGCGKSTLLRLIAGLDSASSGAVERPAHRKTAFVFQDPTLIPWRTVAENVALPLELVRRKDSRARARSSLARVGLDDFATRYPAELSGGMKMRVSLARALTTEPDVLLLDEPFAALDEITRQELDDELRSIWAEVGATILFVTHSVAEATYLADRAIVFSPRPAHIVLDHVIALPKDRSHELRTTVEFANESAILFHALSANKSGRR